MGMTATAALDLPAPVSAQYPDQWCVRTTESAHDDVVVFGDGAEVWLRIGCGEHGSFIRTLTVEAARSLAGALLAAAAYEPPQKPT